jgi:hypothetical protein
MGQPTKHPQSIAWDRCWVCETRFVESGGTEQCHHHHVIPQAFGGTDGPTVSLCDSDHNRLHRIAVCLKGGKPYFTLITGEKPEAIKKLLYLANAVYNAELATRNDPNKAASAMVTLNARHKAMIDKLKSINPKLKSREAVLLCALESLYSKHFIK